MQVKVFDRIGLGLSQKSMQVKVFDRVSIRAQSRSVRRHETIFSSIKYQF